MLWDSTPIKWHFAKSTAIGIVAFSFAGQQREFVRAVAEAVERKLGSGTVFLDEWFEYYIAGADADLKLQNIYGEKCELVVVCVSKQYGGKSWTQAEHEAVRARLMQARNSTDKRDRDRILPIRVGEGEVEGIPFNAIVPDVRGSVIRAADLILRRLQHVVPDERVHPQSDTALPPWKDSPPYPGLRAFSFEEAAIFFGRRGETDDLVARLRECQLLAVIGASGTGRSSLVNAGLLPRLATGAIEGSANWRVVNIRLRSQGANPFLALANELLKLRSQDAKDQPALTAKDVAKNLESDPAYIIRFAQDVLEHNESNVFSELILFIDQFEELFTDFARDYHGKFANLLAAAARHNSRIRVIVTLRVDFQSQALQHPQLAELLQKKGATYLLGPPRPTAFNEIIRRPSELAGIQIEDELIDGILDDVNMDPAALPLVAFCLREVYDTDKSSVTGKMTFAAYQRMGGLHKAIGIRSDEALDALEREGVDVNHALDVVFSKLVTIRRNGKAARGRTTLAELHVDRNAEKVASKLIELRLLTCCVVASANGREGAIVELAHDKLLEKWPVLEGWIKANGKYIQILVDLRYAVLDWIRADRKSSFVWKGKRLKDAKIVFRRASLLPSAGDSEVDAGEIKRFIAASDRRKWINAVAITAAMVAGLVFFPLVIFPSLVPRITMPVGSFEPSPFRLNDVLGNVWEWTSPCIKFGGKDLCAVGGGSWDNHEDWKVQWDYTFPLVDCAYTTVGFRVARNLSDKERQKVSECSKDDGCRETCLKDSNYDKCDKNLVESYCQEGLDCPEMVFIPEGEFPSGASAKNGIKKGPLVIGKNEVTFGEWDACVKGNGCRPVSDENWGRGERPVINVTVKDAEQYLEWLSKATDRPTASKYRLPSEEEWKYAARGGKATPRWWGEEIGAYKANCGACGLKVSQFMDWIWTSMLHLGAYQPKDDEPTCHANLASN